MTDLIHYIFVRKDLPLGVLAAMITHAAGESGALYENPEDGRFRHATAVVLESYNEAHLHDIATYLWKNDIERVEIYETGGPYDGNIMAIGIVPDSRAKLGPFLAKFQTLKGCLDNPPQSSSQSLNPNETN